MRRVLLILNLASLALLLVGWAFSFYRQPVIIVHGYGVRSTAASSGSPGRKPS
jgi:hypothetical protein